MLVGLHHGRNILNLAAPGNDGSVCDFLAVFNYNTVTAILNQLSNRSSDYSAGGYTRTAYIDELIKCNFSAGNPTTDALELVETSIYKSISEFVRGVSQDLGYGLFEASVNRGLNGIVITYTGDYRIFEWENGICKEQSELVIDDENVDEVEVLRSSIRNTVMAIEETIKQRYMTNGLVTSSQLISTKLELADIDNLWCRYGAGSDYAEGRVYDLLCRELKATDIEYCIDAGIVEVAPNVLFNKIKSKRTLQDIVDLLEIILNGVVND